MHAPAHTTPQPSFSTQPMLRMPMVRLGLTMPAVAVIIAVVGAVVTGVVVNRPGLAAGLLAASAVLGASIASVGFMSMFKPRPAIGWAFVIIAASSIRLVLATAIATGLFVSRSPSPGPFWTALLLACFSTLAVEHILLRPVLLSSTSPAAPSAAPESSRP
ncbi:MAG: hypothetical protein KF745_01890 [Phycisphaeraceae bacterium]|nr:hypothetical protein [Phycisphaeraceae bacterium]